MYIFSSLAPTYPVDNCNIVVDFRRDLKTCDATALLAEGPDSLLVLADDIEDVLDVLDSGFLLEDQLE